MSAHNIYTTNMCVVYSLMLYGTIERLHVTSQTLRNHFHVAKEVCQHTHSTHNVVGVDATKHVELPICSESTGLVVLQWFNRFALTIAQL